MKLFRHIKQVLRAAKNDAKILMRGFAKNPNISRTWVLFQIRVIEKHFGIDTFFISPRRLIATVFETVMTSRIPTGQSANYGNYVLSSDQIAENPIVYSGGIGKNISFDLAIHEAHNATVRMFDPTPFSIEYMEQQTLPKGVQFHPWALLDSDQEIDIYFDHSEQVLSASINNFFEFDEDSTFQAQARSLPSLMKQFGDDHIDILKLDIEGVAEGVVEQCLENDIKPDQIVVAFEVPLRTTRFISFIRRLHSLFGKLKDNGYQLYRIRDRSRGVELEVLAVRSSSNRSTVSLDTRKAA